MSGERARRVVVLMGGASAEREVSLTTGAGVAAALRRLGHRVVAVDAASGRQLPVGQERESAGQLAARGETLTARGLVQVPAVRDAEIVFVALHGGAGEDGTLQAVLDLARVPYTGSGRLASALAMDKAMSKRLFEHAGIPTPRWLVLPSTAPPPEAADLEPVGGLPAVVKPNDQGSTVGLTVVHAADELEGAFLEAARHSPRVLIEHYVAGREVTVGILGGEALPVVEIFPEGGLYDYARKYTPGASRYEVPAELPAELAVRLQQLAQRAFETLGCRGVARVDFRLGPDERPYCLEVNTVPGMTPTSLVPMAARAQGISYDALVARMLELGEDAWRLERPRGPAAPASR